MKSNLEIKIALAAAIAALAARAGIPAWCV
jgi:hypothetical protein